MENTAMMEIHICNKAGKLLRAFALGDSNEVIVGRDDACDIQIMAKSVSREHCAIERENGSYILRDLGSSVGTFANGNKVDRVQIRNGLEVGVGPAVLKFFENDI